MPDYRNDAGLLEHLRKQSLNIDEFKTDADADGDDISSIKNDYENMKAITEFCPLADEYKMGAFAIKKALIRGEIGEPIGTLMTAPVFTPPSPLVAGIEKRSRERDGRFKRSKTITQTALDALDLSDASEESLEASEIEPTVEAFPARTGYEAAVVISNRGKSDMWKILGRRKGSENWTELASGTGKSGNLRITPTIAGQPEQLEIAVQLYKNNEPYGQRSQPTYLTVNP